MQQHTMRNSVKESLIFLLTWTFFLVSARNVPSDRSSLIVGGIEAEKGEFPFIVSLRKPLKDHYCGGSIISEDWIITAAHCSKGEESAYFIVAGDHVNNEIEGTEQVRTVERIVIHPDYDALTNDNDIALMKVSSPFQFNKFVQTIELAPPQFIPTPKQIVAGWGRLTEGGPSSTVLMKVEVPYVTDEECRSVYGTRLKDSMTCAGAEGKDACQADSGGPLLCSDLDKQVLCGTVSWGTGCGVKPGVYGKISYFSDWISTVVVKKNF